jgi:hypothetical protein
MGDAAVVDWLTLAHRSALPTRAVADRSSVVGKHAMSNCFKRSSSAPAASSCSLDSGSARIESSVAGSR